MGTVGVATELEPSMKKFARGFALILAVVSGAIAVSALIVAALFN
jgi:hypothetical protein